MNDLLQPQRSKKVASWLMIGVIMLIIQIMLGGITRLTESGLSITEWKPLTGIFPPMNVAAWQIEFEKYRHTDQFRYIHADFSLRDFKFIFFWEWFHRLWARMLGVVFIAGFVYFMIRREIKKEMIIPMLILFLLGAIQGAIGWIMVKSGLLPEQLFVGHIQLATHFIAALFLLAYTFWFALTLLIPREECVYAPRSKRIIIAIMVLLFFQLIYGAFMAGLKAATAAPTWPDINGHFLPVWMNSITPGWKNLLENKIVIQFIHRSLGYLLFLGVLLWWYTARKIKVSALFNKTMFIPVALVILQVLLGILTVIRSPYGNELIYFGVAHQLVAILFLLSMMWMLFLLSPPGKPG